MTDKRVLKVGSRKSQLALIQTELVIDRLTKTYPDLKFEIVTMLTVGDKILDKPLPKIGEKSLFTKELETALENGEVDFVVHSLKDLPTTLPSGLTIGAVLEREDPRDVLILNKSVDCKDLASLPKGSVIGTSSLRRCAQLSRNYPDLNVDCIRGNLNTRLKKLDDDDGKYSGIILAAAGVKRLKFDNRITQVFEPEEFMYAVGQGALAVECNSANHEILEILESLNHCHTIVRVIAERSFLKALGGGCSAPVAVCSTISDDDDLSLVGAVWSLNGDKFLQKTRKITLKSDEPPRKIANKSLRQHVGITARNVCTSDLDAAEKLGIDLAQDLIELGALSVISEAKAVTDKQDVLSVPQGNGSGDGVTNNLTESKDKTLPNSK